MTARSLRFPFRDKGYAATAILTLAVCLAANTATFAIVHSVLLRPLPIPDSDRILLLANRYPRAGASDSHNSAAGDFVDRLTAVPALEDQAVFRSSSSAIELNGAVEQVDGMVVSPSFFRLIRVRPAAGRALLDEEGEPGRERKVVLSDPLARQTGARPGSTLRLNGRPFEVTGIMPAGFTFVDPDVRYWIPTAFTPVEKQAHHSNNWRHVGRLRAGATAQQVQTQVDALNRANLDRFPQFKEAVINAGFHTAVLPLQDMLVGPVRSVLYLLWGGSAFVLLIGALNLANLAVARVRTRAGEFSTRFALGATRWQVWRGIAAENAVLATAGALAGVALAALLLRMLARFGLDRFPRAAEVTISPLAIAAALALALIASLAATALSWAGAMPAAATLLREDGRTGQRSASLRRLLVASEVGFAFVLLAGAGLLLVSFRALLQVDPGYSTGATVQTFTTSAPRARYAGDPEQRSLMDRLLVELRAVPGVESAGATTTIPLSGSYSDTVLIAESYQMQPGESLISPFQLVVTPGYFEAMDMRIVRGRQFDERDRPGNQAAIIVDERLARKFWAGRDPIGQRVYLPQGPEEINGPRPDTKWLSVIGVVRSVRLDSIDSTRESGAFYLPFAQAPESFFTLAVRGGASHAALRQAVARVDRELAVFDVHTMAERTDLSMASRRASMSLALAFAMLALFLSGVGIYGVLAYLVAQRRREIAIRMALGSTQGDVARMVLKEAAWLAGIGAAAGLAGAFALKRTLEQQVYGVQPLDPWVMAAAAGLLGIITTLACLVPARRAAAVDPARALSGDA